MKIIRTQLQSSLSDRGRGGGGGGGGGGARRREAWPPAQKEAVTVPGCESVALLCPQHSGVHTPTTQPLTEGTIRVPKETRVALLGVVTVSYHPATGLWSEDCTLRWQGSRTLRRSKIVIPRGPLVRLLRRDTEDFHSRHSFCLLSVAVINART